MKCDKCGRNDIGLADKEDIMYLDADGEAAYMVVRVWGKNDDYEMGETMGIYCGDCIADGAWT